MQTTSNDAWRRSQVATTGIWGDQGNGTFRNPVIWADYSSPRLLQYGNDFYMVAASQHWLGIPILHSRDLVNWSLIARAGAAQATAPAIVHHDGRFWIYYTNATDGLFVTTAVDPAGPWQTPDLICRAAGWEDAYPFWDDDGGAYLLHSSAGESPLTIHRMRRDGHALIDDGRVLDDTRPNAHYPFVFKRHGFYYVFTTGVWWKTHGSGYAVIVYRSENIDGPYEHRVIFGASSAGRSLGGGGWAEYPAGRWWFLHDMGVPGHGRLPFLETAGWQGDWPWISRGNVEIGAGRPSWENDKANSGTHEPPAAPVASDEFAAPELGRQWQWRRHPDAAMWSLVERPGYLRLRASTLDVPPGALPDSLPFARNVPAQLIMGKRCTVTTIMDVSRMAEGQRAGLSLLNSDYAWIGVADENGRRIVQSRRPGAVDEGPELTGQTIWLRAICDNGIGSLLYSLDGESYQGLGEPLALQSQRPDAHRLALFTYNVAAGRGFVDFDWFHLDHDGPAPS